MKESPRVIGIGRATWTAGLLAAVVGCGINGGAAGNDPVARAQTEADAKKAMLSTSRKTSSGKTTQPKRAHSKKASQK